MKAAIRDPNPVIFLENEIVYGRSFPVPKLDDFVLPIGKARVVREGAHVTLVSHSISDRACASRPPKRWRKKGIEAEIIDLRSLRPLDSATVIESVKKTNRIVTVEQGWPICSIGSEIAAHVVDQAFDYLDAPPARDHRQGRADALRREAREARAADASTTSSPRRKPSATGDARARAMSTQILMPALSPTMEEGKLAKWHVKDGDTVKSGDILAEIETDKATMEFEAIDEGRIGRLLVPEGAEGVKVNAPIATLLGEGETRRGRRSAPVISTAMKAIRDAMAPGSPKPKAAPAAPQQSDAPQPVSKPPLQRLKRSSRRQCACRSSGTAPQRRRTARGFSHRPWRAAWRQIAGVKLETLQGSGPRGRIVKADVDAAAKGGVAARARRSAAPAARVADSSRSRPAVADRAARRRALFYKEGNYEIVPHDSMRKTIARRLTSAKALIPHYYLTIDCDIDALIEVRARLNEQVAEGWRRRLQALGQRFRPQGGRRGADAPSGRQFELDRHRASSPQARRYRRRRRSQARAHHADRLPCRNQGAGRRSPTRCDRSPNAPRRRN